MLLRWLVGPLLLVPACFHPSYDHPACGPHGECPNGLTCSAQQVCEPEGAPIDAQADAPAGICIGRFVAVCRPTAPQNLALIATETINTDTDPRCALQDQGAGVSQLCVMVGNDITVSAQITAIGSHPLVLAAFHHLDITASGSLVLSSPRGGTPGAGANDPACQAPTAGGKSTQGSGGGAGGSFGGSGAAGGTGDKGNALGGTAGAPIAPVARVIGGCKGSPGGNVGSMLGGTPGNGGGAVMLLAGNMLTLAGNVTVGGGGGLLVMATYAGGGGGGSGGFVGLDAMTYAITGQVTANGGGGASGGSSTVPGSPGTDGSPSITIAAPGGAAPSGAGGGGSGSIATQTNGAPGQDGSLNNPYGGGGGGGGAGVILVKGAAPAGGAFSPPLTIAP